MLSDESESNEDLEGFPKKKIRLINENGMQSSEKENTFHSLSLSESKDNLVVEGSQNDNANEMDNWIHGNYKHSVSSPESESDCNVINYDDSESDNYIPISDSEFELEKFINNETNFIKNTNSKNYDESSKDNENSNDNTNSNERTTNKPACDDTDEVYNLLDKAYQDKNYNSNENKKKGVTQDDFKEYEKIVLEEVCKNHFDILPENWIEATHKSGMPIYLHKKSRVVTLSRPYFLGPGDPKSHLAPLSAISCLQYQKGLESKELIKNEPDFQVSKLGDMIIPNAKVETAQENIIKESLTHEELREYCQSLFK